jgi:hypothetical protein
VTYIVFVFILNFKHLHLNDFRQSFTRLLIRTPELWLVAWALGLGHRLRIVTGIVFKAATQESPARRTSSERTKSVRCSLHLINRLLQLRCFVRFDGAFLSSDSRVPT